MGERLDPLANANNLANRQRYYLRQLEHQVNTYSAKLEEAGVLRRECNALRKRTDWLEHEVVRLQLLLLAARTAV